MRRIFWLISIASLVLLAGCAVLNRYPVEGTLALDGLRAPATVRRDEKGMAYIQARTLDDAMLTLGYVTAQDRLFQMTLTRLFAQGRISELAGEKGRAVDIRHRTLGLHRRAIEHARMLEPETRRWFQRYVDGVNAYIRSGEDFFPLEFKLAGISPESWSVADCLSILYYMSWSTSANLKTEIVAQMLIERLGEQKAREIFPLNVNPDDASSLKLAADGRISENLAVGCDGRLAGFLEGAAYELGSNNWVTGPDLSSGGKPVVCNDPHLDARILPGPWYPAGLFTPENRIVGVHIPGLPLMPIFRNQHVAAGITNAYGDMQDLFVETVDPANADRYLEGSRSIPFSAIQETLKIRDKKAEGGFREEPIAIRSTNRGPVVSGVLKGLETDKVMSLRWAPYETMGPTLGVMEVVQAKSAADVRFALAHTNIIMLNFVFGDDRGNFGWHVSGRLPIRSRCGGTVPCVVTDGEDEWHGFVPFDEMPQSTNPAKGWVGTCNHHTVPHDYPYYYSSYQATSYRYRRLKELMAIPGEKTADKHWQYQRDTYNLLAEKLVPFMVPVLNQSLQTRQLAKILGQWDYRDTVDAPGATVFHAIYERFAWLTFADELGEPLARTMLRVWYFWQERFQQMVLTDDLDAWFDDTATKAVVESKQDILIRAALDAQSDLSETLGADPENWNWGDVHHHTFVSPIRRDGFGSGFLGGGTHPAPGSVDTLYRGSYAYDDPYAVIVSASLRMVADLADDDKVLAVIPGGVAGRVFHPHATDQIEAFMNGEKRYWWFSERAIAEHAQSTLRLQPQP
jgi:penicillin G amidase